MFQCTRLPTEASNDHLLFASFADSKLTCYLCKYFQCTFLIMYLEIFVAAIITLNLKIGQHAFTTIMESFTLPGRNKIGF